MSSISTAQASSRSITWCGGRSGGGGTAYAAWASNGADVKTYEKRVGTRCINESILERLNRMSSRRFVNIEAGMRLLAVQALRTSR
jgi:hypothetical protein